MMVFSLVFIYVYASAPLDFLTAPYSIIAPVSITIWRHIPIITCDVQTLLRFTILSGNVFPAFVAFSSHIRPCILYILYVINIVCMHKHTPDRTTDCRPSGESKIDMIPTENRKPTLISVIISRTHQFASVCPIRVETYPFLLHPLQRVTRITSLCSVCGKYIPKTERAYTLCE